MTLKLAGKERGTVICCTPIESSTHQYSNSPDYNICQEENILT